VVQSGSGSVSVSIGIEEIEEIEKIEGIEGIEEIEEMRGSMVEEMGMRMRLRFVVGVVGFWGGLVGGDGWGVTTPLPHGFAHNDYQHARPLMDAVDLGFCNIEADVHWVQGDLWVGHDPEDLREDRTLERLYLKPLRRLVRSNGGQVFPGGVPFRLFVDLKTDALSSYRALEQILGRYAEMLTQYREGVILPGAVTVVVSGERPVEYMRGQTRRLAFLDGRLSDLEAGVSADLFPVISDRWDDHFTWRGKGTMPAEEAERLRRWVERARTGGHLLRFWSIPTDGSAECRVFWETMMEFGVDLINTDDLRALAEHCGG
jgi:hypothetical protein